MSRGLVVCRFVSAVGFWFLAVGWCSQPFSFREVLWAAGWGPVTGALRVSVFACAGGAGWVWEVWILGVSVVAVSARGDGLGA